MLYSKTAVALTLLAIAGSLANSAEAKPDKADANKILDSLQECQAIADAGPRLACYDSRIIVLKQARQVDRDFAGAPAARKFEPITSNAVSVTELQPNVWLLVLADHSVWRTDDDVRFIPKVGDNVKILKGALGSYLASIGKERAVHVKPLH